MDRQITALVAELLYHHDCVIIPGFGGFVARHAPSFIHPGVHSVHPPSKSILFNKNLVNNDGLLANSMIEKFRFSYPDSISAIGKFADDCHRQLHQNLRLELQHIGILFLDAEKNIQFEPQADMNFLLNSFGLSAVYAHPVPAAEHITERKAEPEFTDRKISQTSGGNIARRKRLRRLVAAAVATPFVLGLAFLLSTGIAPKHSVLAGMNPFRNHEKPLYSEPVQRMKIEKEEKDQATETIVLNENGSGTLTLSDDLKNIVFVYVKEEEVPAKATKRSSPKKFSGLPISSGNVSGNYQVVLGCFGVRDNADRLVHTLHSRNINAGISGQNNKGLYVVSAGGFDTKDSAYVLLNAIRQNYPNAWVMTK